jgi:phosphoenolpyruvate carboxykinase (ATP)
VPQEILLPRRTWPDRGDYDRTANKLAGLFRKNFEKYESGCSQAVCQAGPRGE